MRTISSELDTYYSLLRDFHASLCPVIYGLTRILISSMLGQGPVVPFSCLYFYLVVDGGRTRVLVQCKETLVLTSTGTPIVEIT